MPSRVPIVRQKLTPPPVWPQALRRDRLLAALDGAIAGGRHVLIHGGAGFGKTMLASAWSEPRRTVWITLDAEDTALDSFLAYMIAGFEGAVPGFASESSAMLGRARDRSEATAALSTLLADLDEQVDEPLALVLDDYHQAASASLDALLQRLVRYLPASIRLIAISRHVPDIEALALQAKQALVMLDERDLAFNRAELGRLRPELSGPGLAHLLEQTGGWPAAMGMTPEQVDAYLHDQVLRGRSPAVRDFLVRVSILDRIDPDACDQVLGRTFDPTLRDQLLGDRLLVERPEGGYGLPQPLRGMLRRRFTRDVPQAERVDLLRRAGSLLWSRDQALSAIRFWIEAGQVDWAAERLEDVAEDWVVSNRMEPLGSAMQALGTVDRPGLLVTQGEVLRRWGDLERAEACLERAIALGSDQPSIPMRATLRLALTAASRGQVALARERLAAVQDSLAGHDRLEMDARNLLGGIELLGGSLTQAIAHFEASLKTSQRLADPYARARAVHNLGVCYSRLGDFRKSLECYEAAMAPAGDDSTPTVWMTPINRALVLTYLGRLDEAIAAAEASLALVRRYRLTREEGYALRTLGFARMKAGQAEPAAACFESAELLARHGQDTLGIAYSLNFQAELMAAQGMLTAAQGLCDRVVDLLGVGSPALQTPEFAQVRAKVLLLVGRRREAEPLVAALRGQLQSEAQRALIQELEDLLASQGPTAIRVTRSEAPEPLHELEVQCFGGFRVLRSGIEAGDREWQSARAKLLLAYLLHSPEGATKQRLFEVLYADQETSDASFHMNLMRLRKVLEPTLEKGQPSRYILRADGRYQFNRQADAMVDTQRFEHLLKVARLAPAAEEADLLEQALAQYRGDFLPGFDHEWVIGMRHQWRDRALEACRRLLEVWEEAAPSRTLEAVHLALRIDPLSEEFHRELILRFIEGGDPRRAWEHYQLCERRFKEALDAPPPADLHALVAHLAP